MYVCVLNLVLNTLFFFPVIEKITVIREVNILKALWKIKYLEIKITMQCHVNLLLFGYTSLNK